mmetsp:Transcript_21615/g.42998  ORF Transcript_21615/g.42998 Transcript_21615/m.42998 type:complete len:142 (+) Transcript_21615:221-646(+)
MSKWFRWKPAWVFRQKASGWSEGFKDVWRKGSSVNLKSLVPFRSTRQSKWWSPFFSLLPKSSSFDLKSKWSQWKKKYSRYSTMSSLLRSGFLRRSWRRAVFLSLCGIFAYGFASAIPAALLNHYRQLEAQKRQERERSSER